MDTRDPIEPISTDESAPGMLRRLWRILWRPATGISLGTLLALGFAAGIIFWGGFNWSMELTNSETFCISCHEMRDNVYEEYKGSIHDQNRSGVRASCADCHVPREWGYKVVRKIKATNELWHKAVGSIDTREKFEAKRLQLAKNVWAAMKETDSRECRNCHKFESMDLAVQENRARKRHTEAIKEEKTCIDCHKGIAHELPAGAFEAEKELTQMFRK